MLNNKTILITGGTGSLGKRFVERILKKYNPKKVIVYSRDEFKQDLMKKEFISRFSDKAKKLKFFIGDIRDKERLYRAFIGVDYVIHTAAMKQVTACEYNPLEAIKTNIHGAQNIIDACIERKVKKCVALSTDKAINPISLYGGTKLVSDKLFISANAYSKEEGTIFSVVRYGNIAGSRGSVIPFFKDIIKHGKDELPITDFRMSRFWTSSDECIDLAFDALKESRGGEIYISKTPSFRIIDLAKAMLENAKLKEVGIREGEKLHEVMITEEDSRTTYEYKNYYIVYPYFDWWDYDRDFIIGGKPVGLGFEYDSKTNTKWLSIEELREKMKSLKLYDFKKYN